MSIDKGRLHVGGENNSNAPGRITVEHEADDVVGIGLNVLPAPGAGSERAVIKLGGFIIGQDPAGNGGSNFGISDPNGALVFTAEPGGDRMSTAEALAAFAAATAVSTLWHAEIDQQGLTLLENIDGTTPSDAVAWARANALKAAAIAHFNGAGSLSQLGEHKAADAANIAILGAVPAASSTATMCTLAIAIGAAIVGHGDSAGVHFHDDTTPAGTAYTPTSNLLAGNATKANAVTELDALLAALMFHTGTGAFASE